MRKAKQYFLMVFAILSHKANLHLTFECTPCIIYLLSMALWMKRFFRQVTQPIARSGECSTFLGIIHYFKNTIYILKGSLLMGLLSIECKLHSREISTCSHSELSRWGLKLKSLQWGNIAKHYKLICKGCFRKMLHYVVSIKVQLIRQ